MYCNGDTDKEAFDAKLEFDIKVIPYVGDDSWVEKAIIDAHKCLMSDQIPKASEECDFCNYIKAVKSVGPEKGSGQKRGQVHLIQKSDILMA